LSLVLQYRDGIWTPVPIDYSGNFFDVHMFSRDEGWMVGRSVWDEVPEAFFHFQNGTWTRFASPSENVIVGVRTIDSTHAWAVSEGSYGYGGLLYFEGSTIPPTPILTTTSTLTSTSTSTRTATATATETPHPCTVAFNDVPPESTFYPYVMCLACKGIVGGYEDGTFRPNNSVTRGQLSKIVSNAAGFNEPVGAQTFEDVVPGSTFYEFIERMASRDITGGYTCGGAGEPCVAPGNRPYFRPNGNATRGQRSKIVSEAAGFNEPVGGQMFEDVVPGSTFYVWIERLALRGVISGYPCGEAGEPCISPENKPYFRPGNNATRGQTAKIVSRTFNCQLQR
jgi:hypothetical protein